MLEEARGLGELRKQGWAPKRTIVYCAWDGEEPALLGSTEWAETHAAELQQQAVVYLNSDGNGRGFLDAEGSHALEQLHQRRGARHRRSRNALSVWKRKQARAIDQAKPEDEGEGRAAAPTGGSARSARVRLHAVSPAPRHPVAEHRLRRRGQQRHLSLDLRRLLFLHALPRHRLRLRTHARADGGHRGHPAGRCRHPAVPLRESRRHATDLRRGAAKPC